MRHTSMPDNSADISVLRRAVTQPKQVATAVAPLQLVGLMQPRSVNGISTKWRETPVPLRNVSVISIALESWCIINGRPKVIIEPGFLGGIAMASVPPVHARRTMDLIVLQAVEQTKEMASLQRWLSWCASERRRAR